MEIVMKRIILATLIISAVLNLNCPAAGAWAKLGHATIGHIAQEHLTPKARKALSNYLDGKSLAAIASDLARSSGFSDMQTQRNGPNP